MLSCVSLQALTVALHKLGPTSCPDLSLPWDTVRDALDQMAQAAADHVNREHFLVMFQSLQVSVLQYTTKLHLGLIMPLIS